MRLPPQLKDPEFLAKVFLLVIDKVIIGVLIAAAFFIYDRWKTIDTRRYDEARQDVDLNFKRAEYVKELVPVVVDNAQDVMYRAQAFSALVDTKSITASSAVSLANKLLLSDLLGIGRYTVSGKSLDIDSNEAWSFTPYSEYDFFLSTMLKLMPDGLSSMLNEFKHSFNQLQDLRTQQLKTAEQSEKERILEDDVHFWSALFSEMVSRNADANLQLLDNGRFLVDNLSILGRIAHPSKDEALNWFNRRIAGIRILGSINLMESQNPYKSVPYVKALIAEPKRQHEYDLAKAVFDLLRTQETVSVDVAKLAFNILARNGFQAARTAYSSDVGIALSAYLNSAVGYLSFISENQIVAEEIYPMICNYELELFNQMNISGEQAIGTNLAHPTDIDLVQILIKMYGTVNYPKNREIYSTLNTLFSIGEEKLKAAKLLGLFGQWKSMRLE